MKYEDALLSVLSKIDGAGPMDEDNFKWRLVAAEMVIKILYKMGFEITAPKED